MPCEMQHAYTCHNQRQLCHISLNPYNYHLQHLNETLQSMKMYALTT